MDFQPAAPHTHQFWERMASLPVGGQAWVWSAPAGHRLLASFIACCTPCHTRGSCDLSVRRAQLLLRLEGLGSADGQDYAAVGHLGRTRCRSCKTDNREFAHFSMWRRLARPQVLARPHRPQITYEARSGSHLPRGGAWVAPDVALRCPA